MQITVYSCISKDIFHTEKDLGPLQLFQSVVTGYMLLWIAYIHT